MTPPLASVGDGQTKRYSETSTLSPSELKRGAPNLAAHSSKSGCPATSLSGTGSGDIPARWPKRARSGSADLRQEADNDQGRTCDEPGQRIQMLVAAGGGRRMPASGAGTVASHPSHVEKKYPGTSKQAEGRTSGSRPTPKEQADRRDRQEQEWPERHRAQRRCR